MTQHQRYSGWDVAEWHGKMLVDRDHVPGAEADAPAGTKRPAELRRLRPACRAVLSAH
jgi:hypothetical protein